MDFFLIQLFIFLTAAAIAVPVAKKLGLGSVLGYLLAGIIIGPFGFSLIGDVEDIMHFTEFGVVMMLFLVGLELKPSILWQMKTPIFGMGGSQVVLTTLLISGLALFFIPWQQALAIGLIVALSSTAIVLQTLKEKGLLNTPQGKSIFSVLLFQDLAVIPMLAIFPLLATLDILGSSAQESAFFDIHALPGYLQLIITLMAIAFVLIVGKYASRPIFRAIAKTGVREIFVGTALALVVGISLLMTLVGLSPALGTFLAGVVLAESEYRHELESDIEPFKGLLLGVFFITIGANLNFTLIGENILLIGGLVFALISFKWIALILTSIMFKMPKKERALFAIALAQGGEFAFVLFQFSKSNGVLPNDLIEPLISAVAISMFLAPLLFMAYDKFAKTEDREDTKEQDEIEPDSHKVIIAGFGRLGIDLGRFLISAGIRPVIIDYNAGHVDTLRKFGFEVYYGDITRPDLLESAGASEAELLIITIKDIEKSKRLIELAKKHYPNLKIAVNAYDRISSYEIMDLGVNAVRLETFGSAINLGEDALKLIGYDPYEAYKMGRLFKKKDGEILPFLYESSKKDFQNYIFTYQKHNEDLEKLIKIDINSDELEELDKAWTAKNPEK
ncbi:potassium transporter [Campylobacter blaseri]|uniref:Potassium transporter n=1 Tax=Campylobacter blaseri TaxID=2042961 RepID=A0A2P8R3R5_9BACT|nr:monovalent cation:proton antiporter-2 (CPA2) family protein [Campylobacter blaseri]PSM53109.1 potassium transporter [Campylobacter blaseri]PSM54575.1 potassium transporter [Campylobacter blaseri]QKF86952.1 potassium transporter [Campylobacter blaseri]